MMSTKRTLRFFNTTGPCNPDDHYMLPPEDRLVGAQLHRYISDKLYWVLHAPRQTGKTTFLQSWMREINGGGEAVACYVSVEACQGISDAEIAIPSICGTIREFAKTFGLPVPQMPEDVLPHIMLSNILGKWAEMTAPKPLVVLFDETDVLQDAALISFLRQLREGFSRRGIGSFPVSIALVGMRDLKDYITASKGGIPPNPGSPFNIKEDSAQLSNFSKEDITHLFSLRTADNGQQITREALDYVYEQSNGQPWIVNSLFKRATLRILNQDSVETVELKHIEEAREQMIMARETHLDALSERLKEPRIRRVVQAIMTGETDISINRGDPDVMLATDLGLVNWDIDKGFTIANPVYEEILTRCINLGYHDNMPSPSSWRWQMPDGRLDMDALLREFQDFWRNHSETWEQWTNYTEAFPHLLLMAFLQRVVNGGGRIEREYATGRGRMDLAVEYKGEWNIIEIKLLRAKRTFEQVKAEGLKQVARYRETFVPPVGCHKHITGVYLVVFDRRPEEVKPSWDERISWEQVGDVTVLGC
jgi:hypothetical protein